MVLCRNELPVGIFLSKSFNKPAAPVIDIFSDPRLFAIDMLYDDTRLTASPGAGVAIPFAAIDHFGHEDEVCFIAALPFFYRKALPVFRSCLFLSDMGADRTSDRLLICCLTRFLRYEVIHKC
jgi:hypothetical protein